MTPEPAPGPEPPPLAVYVHWPYCARVCPYCDFNVVRDRGRRVEAQALARALVDDLRGWRSLTGPRRLASVFLGGGTPSLMDPEWAADLIAEARSLWTAAADLEVTLEANPTDAEVGRFAAFAQAGVDRLSLGLQALDDAELAFLGRNHDAATGRRAAEAAARAFPRLSLDLIYALPGQSPTAWTRTMREALALGPEHLSPYQLTVEPGTAFGRAVARGRWRPPGPDPAAELYELTQDVLGAAGLDAYEVSNHARGEAARARHNLAGWRGWDYAGVGPGAHGRVTLEGRRSATRAADRVADYLALTAANGVGLAERAALSDAEAAEERLLMGLRTTEGVAFAELAPLGLHAEHARVTDLVDLGLIQASPVRLVATARGRAVLDAIVRALAA